MHFRIVQSYLLALDPRPHHEGVHRSLDVLFRGNGRLLIHHVYVLSHVVYGVQVHAGKEPVTGVVLLVRAHHGHLISERTDQRYESDHFSIYY